MNYIMKKLSIVIPMYYEEEVAEECYNRITTVCSAIENYEYEIITPPLKLCTDNGTMIAWAGLEKYRINKYDNSKILSIKSRWEL